MLIKELREKFVEKKIQDIKDSVEELIALGYLLPHDELKIKVEADSKYKIRKTK